MFQVLENIAYRFQTRLGSFLNGVKSANDVLRYNCAVFTRRLDEKYPSYSRIVSASCNPFDVVQARRKALKIYRSVVKSISVYMVYMVSRLPHHYHRMHVDGSSVDTLFAGYIKTVSSGYGQCVPRKLGKAIKIFCIDYSVLPFCKRYKLDGFIFGLIDMVTWFWECHRTILQDIYGGVPSRTFKLYAR